jgi:hypothetical protein
MTLHFTIRCGLILALLVAIIDQGAGRVTAQPKLIPARFRQDHDSMGFRWDIYQNGSINDGTNDCFDGGLILHVNGQQFQPIQQLMTADGSEFVLSSKIGTIDVTRRVKLHPKLAFVRYVESFTNSGRVPAALTVLIFSNMGGSPSAVSFDSGRPAIGQLGKKESSVVYFENPGSGRPSAMFYLAGTRSSTRPQVMSAQNSDDLRFTYALTVPAGKTVSIVHAVAQRRFAAIPDPKAFAKMTKPLRARTFLRDLPAALRRTIVNTGSAVYGGGGPVAFSIAVALGIEPEATDILAFGEETRMRGITACDKITLKSRFGTQTLELDQVAAIAGLRRLGKTSRVYLRDGQVLSGELQLQGLRFTENTGVEIKLDAPSIERVVMRATPDDGKPTDGAQAYAETYEGDRIAVAYAEDVTIGLATAWGKVKVALDEVSWLRPPESGQPGHHVRLRDGSSFFAYLDGSPIEIRTLMFGNQSVSTSQIKGWISAGAARQEETDQSISLPHVVLDGGHVLVGKIDLPAVRIRTQGEIVQLAPDQVRLLRNLADEMDESPLTHFENPAFGAELWGGSIVVGMLEDRMFPVRIASQLCQIPARDITEIRVPTPTVSDSLRKRIAAAIRDLGHSDFKKRERATQSLQGFGYLARALLQEAVAQTNDPEVRRRAEKLLGEVED